MNSIDINLKIEHVRVFFFLLLVRPSETLGKEDR